MKNKLETVDALQEWGRHFRLLSHPVTITLFRAAEIIRSDAQKDSELRECLAGIIAECGCDLPLWRVDAARLALASESQREAAETADEKPDGQAENAATHAPGANEKPLK